ncbi:hypothetical protein [Sphingomonas sp. CFBP 13720]|uniref:hypothetical protein n=1 Tax=Sphingomonas sp. CFBP 13720 TaxID=2775302 RepID=UPI002016EB5F|nr:hypothetical protein [Sphingomonas sp. CFBP 13720]
MSSKAFRYTQILPALLLVTGCATTNKILRKEPEEVFRVATSADEVVKCLEVNNNKRAIERADGARVVRIRNGYGGVERAFSVYPEGTGSRIEVRKDFLGGMLIYWRPCVGLSPKP